MIHGTKKNTDMTYCTRTPHAECKDCKRNKINTSGLSWYMEPPKLEMGKCPMFINGDAKCIN